MNRADECNGRCEDGNGVVLKMKISVTQFRHPLIFICLTSLEPLNTFDFAIIFIALLERFQSMHNLKHRYLVCVIYSDGSKMSFTHQDGVTKRNTALTCVPDMV